MILNFIRSKSTLAVLAAAVAAVATSANAAILTFTGGNATIVSDSGDSHTVANTSPVPVDYHTTLTGLYGTPTVSNPSADVTKLNFQQLSSEFRATASSALYNATESVDLDGKLVINLHFSTGISLAASIYEDGLYDTTGTGSYQILGGGIAIEAVDNTPAETESGSFVTATTAGSTASAGGWTANASIPAFANLYTDYTITVDNDLLALAPTPGSTADVFKKDFILTLTTSTNPGGSNRTPEPASMGILALGAVGLVARRRK